MSNATKSSGGIGFAGILTIVFITLKLTGNIAWSWWWVLSPIWISFLLIVAIAYCVFMVVFIYKLYERSNKKG